MGGLGAGVLVGPIVLVGDAVGVTGVIPGGGVTDGVAVTISGGSVGTADGASA